MRALCAALGALLLGRPYNVDRYGPDFAPWTNSGPHMDQRHRDRTGMYNR